MKKVILLSLGVFALGIVSCKKSSEKLDCDYGTEVYTAADLRSSNMVVDGHSLAEVEKAEVYFFWEGADSKEDKDWDKESCDKDWDKDGKDWGKDKKDWGKEGAWNCDKGDKVAGYKLVLHFNEESSLKSSKDNLWYEQGTYSVDKQLQITFYPKESDVQSRRGWFNTDKSVLYLGSDETHSNSEVEFILEK